MDNDHDLLIRISEDVQTLRARFEEFLVQGAPRCIQNGQKVNWLWGLVTALAAYIFMK